MVKWICRDQSQDTKQKGSLGKAQQEERHNLTDTIAAIVNGSSTSGNLLQLSPFPPRNTGGYGKLRLSLSRPASSHSRLDIVALHLDASCSIEALLPAVLHCNVNFD